MKLILKISLACLLATGCASKISAQTYVKLNGLYALCLLYTSDAADD